MTGEESHDRGECERCSRIIKHWSREHLNSNTGKSVPQILCGEKGPFVRQRFQSIWPYDFLSWLDRRDLSDGLQDDIVALPDKYRLPLYGCCLAMWTDSGLRWRTGNGRRRYGQMTDTISF